MFDNWGQHFSNHPISHFYLFSHSKSTMHNQRKIFRVFQLISFLEHRPHKTIAQLVELLESSERTVYRYLDLVKACGFDLQKDKNSRFFIPSKDGHGLHFTKEEAQFLEQILLTLGKKHKLRDSILAKIYQASNIPITETNTLFAKNSTLVQKLTKAIENKDQIVLKKYHSINSESISDRVVEPFGFTDHFHALIAFEPASQLNKVYHLERIKSVEFLKKSFQFEDKHEKIETDAFGFSFTGEKHRLQHSFSLKEYLLFINEFPLTYPHFTYSSKKNSYQLNMEAFSMKPMEKFTRGVQNAKTE